MRRCCEQTMRIMRENREVLLTIIEVFIHDPLYNWALTVAAVRKRQCEDVSPDHAGQATPAATPIASTEREAATGTAVVNADAERTLLRVQAKLEGNETGALSPAICMHCQVSAEALASRAAIIFRPPSRSRSQCL